MQRKLNGELVAEQIKTSEQVKSFEIYIWNVPSVQWLKTEVAIIKKKHNTGRVIGHLRSSLNTLLYTGKKPNYIKLGKPEIIEKIITKSNNFANNYVATNPMRMVF